MVAMKIINIMAKTLNYVDKRLIDHGKRVSYLMFRILEPQHKFGKKQLRDICLLAMLHDVGAYKTEEIDRMAIFENYDIWEHSIYGYLFMKHFSPLKDLAPSILYHHAECCKIADLEPTLKLLAHLLFLCDRADFLLQNSGTASDFINFIEKHRGTKFGGDAVDMFLASGVNIDTVFDHIDLDIAYKGIFQETPLSEDEINGYIKMIIFLIDFRSSQTVIHTITTASAAVALATMLNAGKNEIEKIRTGAMLHDIGKIGIPVPILEFHGKLNDSDMKVMRRHVEITEEILNGNVDEDIKNIASRHHEKLNGTGYHKGLSASELSQSDRIVAVADIFSALCGIRNYKRAFSKEKVIAIFKDMSEKNFLDAEIVALAIERFDDILEKANRESEPVAQAYDNINEEYVRLLSLPYTVPQ
jgi:putative nucleotidyltransferase with HDIG domain